MESMMGTLLLVVVGLITFEYAKARITVGPINQEAMVGSSAFLNCSTSLAKEVHWYHYPAGTPTSTQNYVYYYGQLHATYKGRFEMVKNESMGSYDIFIRKVERTDAGVYACQDDEGSGETVSAELIVLEGAPVCTSTMNLDGVIGVNSCNMEPEILKLSCSVSYRGKNPPKMEWRNIDEINSTTEGVTTEKVDNRITSQLTLTGEPSIDGSSYVCQTSNSHHHCISSAIRIIYAVDNTTMHLVTMGDTVICKANASSQDCTYRWKWFKGDDIMTVSDNRTLIPDRPGTFRCETVCYIRKNPCTITAMLVYVEYGNATNAASGNDGSTLAPGYIALIVFLVAIIIGAIIILVVCLYCRRLGKKRFTEGSLPTTPDNYVTVKVNGDNVIPMEEKKRLMQDFDDASDVSDFSALCILLPYIDKGSSGEVYGPCQFEGNKSAFQRILYSTSSVSTEKAKEEIVEKGNHWKDLDHANVIKFYRVCFESPTLYVHVFMEFAEGESVRKALDLCEENLPCDVATNWALQIASGMEYLHAKEIVHSHLKSAQVLIKEPFDPPDVSSKTLKISSYRIKTESKQSAPGSFKGMFAWESPESIELQERSKARDIWSYGVTVWEILTRDIPYSRMKNVAIMTNVKAGNKELAMPAVLHYLMKNCWAIDPQHRPSFSDIVTNLKDGKLNMMAISDGKVVPEEIVRMTYIDKGASGEVFGPFLFLGSKCACERIMFSPAKLSSATEYEICHQGKRWMELKHRNVLTFYDVRFQHPTLYVVMDYAEGGSVRNALDLCTEDLEVRVVKDWATQIADGMNHLLTKDIVHGRLKAAQVLIMEPFDPNGSYIKTLKIASFSLTTSSQPSVQLSFKGMFAWMAPEVIQDSQDTCKASDVWSFGVTIWEILTRAMPYKGAKHAALIESIREGNSTLLVPKRCPDALRNILRDCWILDKDKRATFSDISSRLNAIADC